MKINISSNAKKLGEKGAKFAAQELRKAIEKKGHARLLLSTGASQFEMFDVLIKEDLDWSKVEMFHLDEYIDLPTTHKASFRKYLKERFLTHVNIKNAYLVNGEGDIEKNLETLTAELRKAPIDVALIGIGENSHIAFNDPKADFDTKEAYFKVKLDEVCRQQQVGEGWFNSFDEVPEYAITMSVYQIMQSKLIITCVPHKGKSEAIRNTFKHKLDPMYPSTILKYHDNWNLYLDENSADLLINKN